MDRMREVIDGVFEIRLGFVNVHLVVTDGGLVLVDTGIPGRAPGVARALHEARREVGEVRTILLTHRHVDHIGSAAELRRRSGARLVAHAADVPVITTGVQPVGGPLRLLAPLMPKAEAVPVDEVLTTDGPFSVPGFTAVHTPGHTLGHVSYLLDRDGGLLFAGDAARNGWRGVRRTPRMLTEDVPSARHSMARLAGLDFRAAVFGHGGAVTDRAVDRFRAAAGA